MGFTKKEWTNVPDPDNYTGDIPLSALPRFDAANMNRIEGGIEEALALTPDDIGALSKTKHIQNTDILSITEEGFYYSVLSKNIPTTEVAGYVRVIVASYDYRVVYWRPYNSLTEYVNVFKKGAWLGWVETLTNAGGTLMGYLEFKNLDSYQALKKGRTVAGVVHNLSVGVSSNGASTMEHYTGDVLDGRLELMPVADNNSALILRENSSGTKKAIFGEHNKRAGLYTGNGESNRIVEIGGICPCLLISWEATSQSFCSVLVTTSGFFGVSGSSAIAAKSTHGYLKDREGIKVLSIPDNGYLNLEGKTYYYQSL